MWGGACASVTPLRIAQVHRAVCQQQLRFLYILYNLSFVLVLCGPWCLIDWLITASLLSVELHVAALPVVTTRMLSISILTMAMCWLTTITIYRFFFCFSCISLQGAGRGVTVPSNFWDSFLFMCTPFDTELPKFHMVTAGEGVWYRWSATPSPKGRGPNAV